MGVPQPWHLRRHPKLHVGLGPQRPRIHHAQQRQLCCRPWQRHQPARAAGALPQTPPRQRQQRRAHAFQLAADAHVGGAHRLCERVYDSPSPGGVRRRQPLLLPGDGAAHHVCVSRAHPLARTHCVPGTVCGRCLWVVHTRPCTTQGMEQQPYAKAHEQQPTASAGLLPNRDTHHHARCERVYTCSAWHQHRTGDHITATCVFNSSLEESYVAAGPSHSNEMCNLYLMSFSQRPVFMSCYGGDAATNYRQVAHVSSPVM